ncbi:MAG: putative beta-lysine N-acetyltransferase [Syntrophomonadaceae bacterium]|nr:putative beta-lysine N-acetyltransferase [Syntrophomonadaceae bacterium]MDD3022696.1 putative beta-lysine N-acetyltransferase [Syntrophomonadaceae bacterium]
MANKKVADQIENYKDAVIQHGTLSNRIYLMHLGEANPEEVIAFLNKMAVKNGYTKIFAKIPKKKADAFIDQGYHIEAVIPLFYKLQDEGVFLGKYLSADRSKLKMAEQIDAYLQLAHSHASEHPEHVSLLEGANIRECMPGDIKEMSALYRTVFETYPFPIHDPGYIRDTMQFNTRYFGVEMSGRLIALSSAEMCPASQNVEMTDFATDPAWLGHRLAVCLLERMEQEMMLHNITSAYTIARALSPAMNISFAKRGYFYGGTLINNTNIAGQIESMNVWYKFLV